MPPQMTPGPMGRPVAPPPGATPMGQPPTLGNITPGNGPGFPGQIAPHPMMQQGPTPPMQQGPTPMQRPMMQPRADIMANRLMGRGG